MTRVKTKKNKITRRSEKCDVAYRSTWCLISRIVSGARYGRRYTHAVIVFPRVIRGDAIVPVGRPERSPGCGVGAAAKSTRPAVAAPAPPRLWVRWTAPTDGPGGGGGHSRERLWKLKQAARRRRKLTGGFRGREARRRRSRRDNDARRRRHRRKQCTVRPTATVGRRGGSSARPFLARSLSIPLQLPQASWQYRRTHIIILW